LERLSGQIHGQTMLKNMRCCNTQS
jgi:hypothetical protein